MYRKTYWKGEKRRSPFAREIAANRIRNFYRKYKGGSFRAMRPKGIRRTYTKLQAKPVPRRRKLSVAKKGPYIPQLFPLSKFVVQRGRRMKQAFMKRKY